ncbi:MAG: hypothetical protein DI598_03375 [Pseudopedobacter saltans]|uniref:Uncharacterized protein n=1 Tax=Pseudopedobacter saltans TaxID=151895 RepID=A0A2W5F5J1_9SPHI|nr:MAG: hypothetical protein DI598_03375 [Pseudopedobacter saltans]
MKLINYILCTLAFFPISSVFGQSKSPNMTVFGYTMGKPFNIPECKKEIEKEGSYKYYSYDRASANCDCYEIPFIVSYKVKKKESVMPTSTQLQKDDTVNVYFKPTNIPDISYSEHCVAGITNSNLTEVVFFTKSSDADLVLKELTQKYGKDYTLKYYRSYDLVGNYRSYYIARWEFSDLLVIFQSDAIEGAVGSKMDRYIGDVTIRLIDPNRFNTPKGRGL